jgi:AraC family L-rhamnose operon transcriptional activator RhaR
MNNSFLTLIGSYYWQSGFPISMSRESEIFSLPLHVHDFIEINFVAEGCGFHYIGDERLKVERGELFIIPVGTPHVYRPTSPTPGHELIVYNCLFAPELLSVLRQIHSFPTDLERMLTTEDQPYRHFKDSNQVFRQIIESMFKENSLQSIGYQVTQCALLLQLLITMYRFEQKVIESESSFNQLEPVFTYIAAHYNEIIPLNTLATTIPISVSYLQRIFKRMTGQSVTEYLQNLRIEKSCEQLQNTPLSVRDIAGRVGYKDIKFFHALFKKKTGISPYQYRKKSKILTL